MKKNILAIDDEFSIRYFYKISFEKKYNIITLKDGREALEYLNDDKNKIDIIILDLMLPGIDGIEILKNIKNHKRTKQIPVIVVSVKHQPETINKIKDLGAEDYLIKPFEPDKLYEKIEILLAKNDKR